jgi:uncharacterized protein (TIGR01568 family)
MAPAWPWPSSKNPRTTQSTRSTTAPPGAKTIASIVLDSAEESSFTTSSAQPDCCSDETVSTVSEPLATGGDTADDAVVRGVRSDRLLFDPPGASATSSILDEKALSGDPEEAFVGGVAVAFESENPYADFRASMVEMVGAHGVGDWGWMEEMLGWYLRANDRDTHCAIVAAFIDVVIAIADPAGEAHSASSRSSSRTFPGVDMEMEVAEKSKVRVFAA